MCDNTLDNLFDDADQGICSNDTPNNGDIGLTSLTEGLCTITHGLKRSSFSYETSERQKEEE